MKWHVRKAYFPGFGGYCWGVFGFGYVIECSTWDDAIAIVEQLTERA